MTEITIKETEQLNGMDASALQPFVKSQATFYEKTNKKLVIVIADRDLPSFFRIVTLSHQPSTETVEEARFKRETAIFLAEKGFRPVNIRISVGVEM